MKSPERIIYVPLGDRTHERAAFCEACKLTREIVEEEFSKGRFVSATAESLQQHPKVSKFYYLRKPIQAMGGYLVKIEKMKTPRRT